MGGSSRIEAVPMRYRLLFLLLLFAGNAVPAADTLKRGVPTPATPSPKNARGEKHLHARPPIAGQPFDDRELALYFAAEAHRLLAARRLHPLHFDQRSCAFQPAIAGTEKLPPTTIAARAEAATLVLGEFTPEGKKREPVFATAGGAFVVDPSGICLTSLHVARSKNSLGLCALTRDGRVLPVRSVLAFEPLNDLALLQLDLPAGVTLPALPLAKDPSPIGSPVFVMSHPDDRFYLLTQGHTARHTLWRTEAGDEAFMAITADFAKGSSGCPVIDECGTAVGIVNNTESIYYDDDGARKQTDLQMVVKNTTPSWAAWKMSAAPRTP